MSVTKATRWFEVDKEGLSKLIDRRGRATAILELTQNAWDAPGASNVRITLRPVNGTTAELLVIDDSPEGFTNLEHAFTIFAESTKKSDPSLRGRFNLGEKLVLALCKSASIVTRKGTVAFGDDGSRIVTTASPSAPPKIGTTFHAMISMTKEDCEDARRRMRTLIPAIPTTFNNEVVPSRTVLGQHTASLFTEQADAEGIIRRVQRATTVELYEVLPGETASLYELGIPVCETGDCWHINVKQRVPLNIERDGVTPAYMRTVRAVALDIAVRSRLLDRDTASAPWVDDAMSSTNFDADNTTAILDQRFGEKRVIYDPSDLEANKRATAAGYVVIHGGAFSKPAWEAIKAAGAALPAGKVTPSPKPYAEDGTPLVDYPISEWSKGMHAVFWFAQRMADGVLSEPGRDPKIIGVRIVNAPQWRFSATYGPSGTLVLNVGCLGKAWFDQPQTDMTEMLDLLIHEFGHEYESDHLSESYYRALTRTGARTAMWLHRNPNIATQFLAMY